MQWISSKLRESAGKGTEWWQAAWVGRAMLCVGAFLPRVHLALGCTRLLRLLPVTQVITRNKCT